jgi:hypothetical protein
MTLVFIPGNAPSYQALSSDIDTSSSTINGAKYIGADVWITDTNTWYRTTASGVLVPIYTSASPTTTVSISGTSTVAGPVPTVDIDFNGQIYISSSVVPTSGSNFSSQNRNGYILKSHPSNTGVAWIYGLSGSLSGSAGGFPLSVGESVVFSGSALGKLNYAVTGATSGCLCWMRI